MVKCVVLNCNSRGSKKDGGIRFHRFPLDTYYRNKWIKAVGRSNWLPTKSSKICSSHFRSQFIILVNNKVFLSKVAVPTLNLPTISNRPLGVLQYEQVQYSVPKITFNSVKSCQIKEENDTDYDIEEISQASPLVTSHKDENTYLLADPLHIDIKTDDDNAVTEQEPSSPSGLIKSEKYYQQELIKKDEIIKAMKLEMFSLRSQQKQAEFKLARIKKVSQNRLQTIWRLRKHYQRHTARIKNLEEVLATLCEVQNLNRAELINVMRDEKYVC